MYAGPVFRPRIRLAKRISKPEKSIPDKNCRITSRIKISRRMAIQNFLQSKILFGNTGSIAVLPP
jgi:hypothetical protein